MSDQDTTPQQNGVPSAQDSTAAVANGVASTGDRKSPFPATQESSISAALPPTSQPVPVSPREKTVSTVGPGSPSVDEGLDATEEKELVAPWTQNDVLYELLDAVWVALSNGEKREALEKIVSDGFGSLGFANG